MLLPFWPIEKKETQANKRNYRKKIIHTHDTAYMRQFENIVSLPTKDSSQSFSVGHLTYSHFNNKWKIFFHKPMATEQNEMRKKERKKKFIKSKRAHEFSKLAVICIAI